ncbi:unnamed protein product [Rotaria magnacalcarata]|uniref:G-protein coupled receptors family 1 profile domain-containing protein n=2 Tax=Rotaria magnacalcarata TaxID=392030 RepID=A0A816VEZ4_9BILA|nr:unnamed protein product [Rotaria magnacalcarata]CAF2059418.1 unnamed protein product [Rotaria magnacalcarata]CAF2112770.1 unnamed protein product [Rotaria magnacalcarata]CAF3764992.1 unnamed protein product [Rotaria magnacalcarata]CAF3882956.1 unnamed protein product [Rotaria magnacalcarata]
MTTNTTLDSSRDLRHTRLVLLSILFIVGLTGCSIVIYWLIRYARWNMRSARICSLILNLVIADLSVYIFATGIQIFWEFQTNRQWPFNDFLCRVTKFFQSFSILSSSYIVVIMAIDRCVAIVSPLKVGKIRVLHLCGSAWILAGLLSTPNIFIFHLHINGTARHCAALFNHQTTLTGRRIYLTFISLVVYFIPFIVLVLCYILIFIKLLWRERDQNNHGFKHDSPCCSWLLDAHMGGVSKMTLEPASARSASNRSSFSEYDARRKRANTYAKARTKTFRMIIILVLFMIIFGAPYYCLELYVAYTGRHPPHLVLALAGGAAVAPSSLDPWIFLLFWANWNQPTNVNNSRKIVNISLQQKKQIQQQQQQQQQQCLPTRRMIPTNTPGTSSSSDPRQYNQVLILGQSRLPPYTIRWNTNGNRHNKCNFN